MRLPLTRCWRSKMRSKNRCRSSNANAVLLSDYSVRRALYRWTTRFGYLPGAPGVDWKPPNSFRPSDMVTVRALATVPPFFAR
jgi:hypothetical protein